MVQVVSDICGVHAQMSASAELMLGMRVRGITREDVRDALWRRRTLVKTVGLRGTLHLLPAREVPTWMAANRLRFDSERQRYVRLGMDVKNLDRLVDAISEVVGPEPIDRPELERELEARVGKWATTRNQAWAGNYPNWPLALGWAAAAGRLCYGPGQGGRATFVSLADWSGWREEDPHEAGRYVLKKFLRAYGPSTVAEFARWFALEQPLARRLFAESPGLVEVDVEGSKRWMPVAGANGAEPPHPKAVHLLPHFDVYVVGFSSARPADPERIGSRRDSPRHGRAVRGAAGRRPNRRRVGAQAEGQEAGGPGGCACAAEPKPAAIRRSAGGTRGGDPRP